MSIASFQSFPRSCRLHCSRDYQWLRRSGKRTDSPSFTIYYLLSSDSVPRLGLTVSRKVGNAVQRNCIKRRVREFFRTRRVHFLPGLVLSVLVRPSAAQLDHQQLDTELTQLLSRQALTRSV